MQNPKTIAGCKRARSYSFDEESNFGTTNFVRTGPSGGRIGGGIQGGNVFLTGNRFLPLGGAISSTGSHGPQRLFAKNSFSSSTDVSTLTPVVPEDKELPPTKATPPTRLSLGGEHLGVSSGSMTSGFDSAPVITRVSPDLPMRLSGSFSSSSNTG